VLKINHGGGRVSGVRWYKYACAVSGEQQIGRRHVQSSRTIVVHPDPRRGDGQVGEQARLLLVASFLVLIQVQDFADKNSHQFIDALGLGNLVADDTYGGQRLAQSCQCFAGLGIVGFDAIQRAVGTALVGQGAGE
jgi:hypothetical protein